MNISSLSTNDTTGSLESNAPNIQDLILNIDEESNVRNMIHASDVRPTDIIINQRGGRSTINAFQLLLRERIDEYGDQYARTPRRREQQSIQHEMIQFVHHHGGRFLLQHRSSSQNINWTYEEASLNATRKKIASLFRGNRYRRRYQYRNVGNPQDPVETTDGDSI
jgi:hypothetical protein